MMKKEYIKPYTYALNTGLVTMISQSQEEEDIDINPGGNDSGGWDEMDVKGDKRIWDNAW